jgi:[ribosomal protein S5]-alanine N-acetyltransferase
MLIETARLILREFRDDDFDAVREYDADPVTRLYEPPIRTEEYTREALAAAQAGAQEEPRKRYMLAVTVRPDDRVRGRVTLKLMDEEVDEWEIGWTIHQDYCGRGYATEAATAMLRVAFEGRHAHRVMAFCNVNNAASVRVMQKLGMTREGHFREALHWNGGWADQLAYAILDREWASPPLDQVTNELLV